MDIILYEDEAVSGLFPVTLTRPAFDIRTAGYTLLEAAQMVFPKATFYARSRELVHAASHLEQFPASARNTQGHLFLNARVAPSLSAIQMIAGVLKRSDEECAFMIDGAIAGVFTSRSEDPIPHASALSVRHDISGKLLAHPEDIIFFNKDSLKENLIFSAKKKGFSVARGVKIPKQCVLDTTHGPIVIGSGVSIAPFTVLRGPLIIREDSVVKEFTVLEGSTIGPTCKVGGEVSCSIIDGYSNKQHAGSLGDSYIGRWVNLAAGTTVSNLKNTYSHVTIDGRDSGAQFLGAVFGDHSKMASNASIFPGKIVGVSAHLYGIITTDVPSFTTYVPFGRFYELPVAITEKGQKAMFERRGMTWTDADTTLLGHVFTMTKGDREAKNVSAEKLSF